MTPFSTSVFILSIYLLWLKKGTYKIHFFLYFLLSPQPARKICMNESISYNHTVPNRWVFRPTVTCYFIRYLAVPASSLASRIVLILCDIHCFVSLMMVLYHLVKMFVLTDEFPRKILNNLLFVLTVVMWRLSQVVDCFVFCCCCGKHLTYWHISWCRSVSFRFMTRISCWTTSQRCFVGLRLGVTTTITSLNLSIRSRTDQKFWVVCAKFQPHHLNVEPQTEINETKKCFPVFRWTHVGCCLSWEVVPGAVSCCWSPHLF